VLLVVTLVCDEGVDLVNKVVNNDVYIVDGLEGVRGAIGISIEELPEVQ